MDNGTRRFFDLFGTVFLIVGKESQMITGYTKMAGVIATPIKHSLSPLIHNSAYQFSKLDAVYLAFDVETKNCQPAFEAITALNMMGVNISMPYKTQAYQFADEVSEVSRRLGVCNTLINREGLIYGTTTDGYGFSQSLKDEKVDVELKKVVILGAGGASKAVAYQLGLENAAEIHIFKRNNETFAVEKNHFLAFNQYFNSNYYFHSFSDQHILQEKISNCDILINATNVGMAEASKFSPIKDANCLQEQTIVFDLIYNPLETKLMCQAREKNCHVINGVGMLLHQAAASYELMTGEKMAIEHVKQILLTELKRRETYENITQ